jgi:hypothetical protein
MVPLTKKLLCDMCYFPIVFITHRYANVYQAEKVIDRCMSDIACVKNVCKHHITTSIRSHNSLSHFVLLASLLLFFPYHSSYLSKHSKVRQSKIWLTHENA